MDLRPRETDRNWEWSKVAARKQPECRPGSGGTRGVPVRRGPVQWRVRSTAIIPNIQGVLHAPDACLAQKESWLKHNERVTLGRVPASFSGGQHWLLRRSNYGRSKARLRDFFRLSAPMRAFRNGLHFEAVNVPTPRVLAAGIVRVLQQPVVGYLLVEEIPAALTLMEYLEKHGAVPPAAVRRVAVAVAEMHEHGFVHGDLTLRNVLLDERLDPWLIDLERAEQLGGPVNWQTTVEDFFRFARYVIPLGPQAYRASLRLVKHYCRLRGWGGREREFADAVLGRLREKVKPSRLR